VNKETEQQKWEKLIRMQLLWLLVGLISVAYSAVPNAPRKEGKSDLSLDCKGEVAFSVSIKPTREKEEKNEIITFDTSLIEKNYGYSRENGIFTTQCPGLYSISFTVKGDGLGSRFSLRERPSSLTNSWSTLITTDKKGGSYTIIHEMELGEQLAVFINDGALTKNSHHTFSGHKL